MSANIRDYAKLAAEIRDQVGEQNIVSAAHCATRLRLVLKESPSAEVSKRISELPAGPVFFSGKAGLVWPLAKKIRWNRLIPADFSTVWDTAFVPPPGRWSYSAGRARAYPFPGSFT